MVAQGEGHKFKPWYWQKKERNLYEADTDIGSSNKFFLRDSDQIEIGEQWLSCLG
jgi:hypothetical protein